jgi:phosphatidylserine/phosphatidylglycerophosphate/cardiolipin synthase-like enzyme
MHLIDRRYVPRMPWHDISLHVVGQAARDVSRHFVERWNFIKLDKGMVKEQIPFLMPAGEFVSTRDERDYIGTCDVQVVRSSANWSSGIEREVNDRYKCPFRS